MHLHTDLQEYPEKSLLRIRLYGALSSDTAPAFEDTLNDAMGGDSRMIVLDLRDLEYISSAGLRVIFKAAKELKADDRSLAWRCRSCAPTACPFATPFARTRSVHPAGAAS